MSTWRHNICRSCWEVQNPDRRPVRMVEAPTDVCCFCVAFNQDGIYVRHDPADTLLLCRGNCVEERKVDYDQELPDYGDLLTIAEYQENCKSRMFIDYDGVAHPVKDGKMARGYVRPSNCPRDIPDDATHIMWFNR